MLCSSFITQSGFRSTYQPPADSPVSLFILKTDAHYSILSLLLCLSDSPSNSNYVETPREKEVGMLPDTNLFYYVYSSGFLLKAKNHSQGYTEKEIISFA